MRYGVWICLALLWSSPLTGERLSGDTDGDGDVDFADFLSLAANFGREDGTRFDPTSLAATSVETLFICNDQTILAADRDIEGLAAIDLIVQQANFDPDPELDGWAVSIRLLDLVGETHLVDDSVTVVVDYEVGINLVVTDKDMTEYYPASMVSDTLKVSQILSFERFRSRSTFTIGVEQFNAPINAMFGSLDAWVDSTIAADYRSPTYTDEDRAAIRLDFDIASVHEETFGRLPILVTMHTRTREYQGSDILRGLNVRPLNP